MRAAISRAITPSRRTRDEFRECLFRLLNYVHFLVLAMSLLILTLSPPRIDVRILMRSLMPRFNECGCGQIKCIRGQNRSE